MKSSDIIRFFRTDLWRIRTKDLPPVKGKPLAMLRTLAGAGYRFHRQQCTHIASALTFFSLLSIVPVAATAFGIAKGFGMQKRLEEQILENIPGQEEVLLHVFNFAQNLLSNAKGGLVAGVGAFVLLWSVVKVLHNTEEALNTIFEAKKGRAWARKITDYLAFMLIGPLVIISSGGVTVFIKTSITHIMASVAVLGVFAPLVTLSLKLIPLTLLWLLFSFVYTVMPNTRVRVPSAMIAALLTALAYQIVQYAFIHFQVVIAKYNAIYGSFAAFPLFLIWLQVSWFIFLFGAETAFVHMCDGDFIPGGDKDPPRQAYHLTALLTAWDIIKRFAEGLPPEDDRAIAARLRLPVRLVRRVLDDLVKAGLVSEVVPANGAKRAFQPGVDIAGITAARIIAALDGNATGDPAIEISDPSGELTGILAEFREAMLTSGADKPLKNI